MPNYRLDLPRLLSACPVRDRESAVPGHWLGSNASVLVYDHGHKGDEKWSRPDGIALLIYNMRLMDISGFYYLSGEVQLMSLETYKEDPRRVQPTLRLLRLMHRHRHSPTPYLAAGHVDGIELHIGHMMEAA